MRPKTFALAASAALLIGLPAAGASPSPVAAADAWCRAAPPGAPSGGCYVTLTAPTGDRLVGVDTAAADHAEIHTMDMTGGVMRMRRLPDGIALPAGKPVALKPGSLHLMIIGPKRQLTAGGVVPMTLRFAKAPPLRLQVPIRMAPSPAASPAHHGDHQ